MMAHEDNEEERMNWVMWEERIAQSANYILKWLADMCGLPGLQQGGPHKHKLRSSSPSAGDNTFVISLSNPFCYYLH
jgi:hypothetical protein